MNGPVRLGMIGCGFIAEAHGRAARKLGSADAAFVACASRDPDRRSRFAATFGCRGAYETYQEMFAAGGLDAVVIASPPVAHKEQILAALNAGICHILCEKPLSLTLAEAIEVRAEARRRKAKIIEAYHYRYNPLFARIKELMSQPEIGKIDHFRGHVHLALPPPGEGVRWRRDPEQGGGVAHEYACYPIDTFNVLAGAPPISVSAWMDERRWRLYGRVRYANGIVGIVEASYEAVFDQSLSIVGRRGAIRIPKFWVASTGTDIATIMSAETFGQELKSEPVPPLGKSDDLLVDWPVYTYQLAAFVSVVRGQAAECVTIDESVTNMAVIDGFLQSAHTGCDVPLGSLSPA